MEGTLNSGKISQKQVWNKISQDMKKKGYDVTGPQCHSKIRSLKKTYKSTKDHNNKSGNNRKTWQFYDVSTNILHLLEYFINSINNFLIHEIYFI